jgi:hypothetical protein
MGITQLYMVQVETLPNGLHRAFDLFSKLVTLFNADGTHRSGPLTEHAKAAVARHIGK